MQRVSTYLNFMGNTEEAFAFYASVFGTEPEGPMMRMGDMPPTPGARRSPGRTADDHAHRAPDPGRYVLMATDMLESMGTQLRTATT